MTTERSYHAAVTLQDGRVFIVGGNTRIAATEIFDPATKTFRRGASTSHIRFGATATLLNDGRVLVAGGSTAAGAPDATAEVYDPRTDSFTATGDMNVGRVAHSAVLLLDGRVLLTGGAEQYNSGLQVSLQAHAHAEIYDPASNSFTPAGDMNARRWYHTSTLLPDGTVLVAGLPLNAPASSPAAEIFDPQTRTFRAVSGGGRRLLQTATLLNSGSVLLAGGNFTGAPVAEIYQPSTGVFQQVSAPISSSSQTATLLKDGRVLFTGWSPDGFANAALAIYDPATNSISPAGSMAEARAGQSANRLPDGTVLVAGGAGTSAEVIDAATTAVAPAYRRRATKH